MATIRPLLIPVLQFHPFQVRPPDSSPSAAPKELMKGQHLPEGIQRIQQQTVHPRVEYPPKLDPPLPLPPASFDKDNSNVVKFLSLLKKDDKNKQRVSYQFGIGTYSMNPRKQGMFSPRKFIGYQGGQDLHLWYTFLCSCTNAITNEEQIGFSRGAYTARSLAGMIHKVGLLPAGNIQQVAFAYKIYRYHHNWTQPDAFKKACSIDVKIEFLGVWDTVNSVGLTPKDLPFTTSNTVVKSFRHAISLDERSVKFKANLWHQSTDEQRNLGWSSRKAPVVIQKENQDDRAQSSRLLGICASWTMGSAITISGILQKLRPYSPICPWSSIFGPLPGLKHISAFGDGATHRTKKQID
ncbi:hypothetical protein BDN72DRAFT_882100 [Pluteus cervinus]|uniref:Uncharacterized protein n=1 Tax=Pluteus cervinus TaxID=181527 RepID=A0ACD3ACZ3_9AGAR|nr:hypothetical protein BDN72DRAFT_882100 [Pluteus cervinus]